MTVNQLGTDTLLLVVLLGVFTIPGWAMLALTGIWKRFQPLQSWCLAAGLSIAFYPVLYYLARLIPDFHLGFNKLLVILFVFLLVIVFFLRKDWKKIFAFDILEGITLFVILGTLFTRLWMAYLYPYPAWSDSLHHTLLTQLTAISGRLPVTLDPYEPSNLDMYHLGLYAITATVQNFARVPAFTALLWTAQFLNGLCGLGIFLVLDRWVGRKGALAATVLVGLLSFQPAWYFNWGRFTQIASQAIILIAWVVTLEAVHLWSTKGKEKGNAKDITALVLLAALLNAGVFLLHFRVGGFYAILLVISLLPELYRARQEKALLRALRAIFGVGFISLLLILPVLWPAMQIYIQRSIGGQVIPTSAEQSLANRNLYYDYTLQSVTVLAAKPWLIVIGCLSLLVGLYNRSKLAWIMLAWMGMLWLVGNAYRIGAYWLSFDNYTGILIMYYLPIALLVGNGIELSLTKFKVLNSSALQKAILAILLFFGFVGSHFLVNGVEAYRQFVTPGDVSAMDWINANLPKDAKFAINSYIWLGSFPIGTDGGYWIPYFTGRGTTAGTMMASYAPDEYVRYILSSSQAVTRINDDKNSLDNLCHLGVKYLYIGAKGNFQGGGFDYDKLAGSGAANLLYHQTGVSIFKICP